MFLRFWFCCCVYRCTSFSLPRSYDPGFHGHRQRRRRKMQCKNSLAIHRRCTRPRQSLLLRWFASLVCVQHLDAAQTSLLTSAMVVPTARSNTEAPFTSQQTSKCRDANAIPPTHIVGCVVPAAICCYELSVEQNASQIWFSSPRTRRNTSTHHTGMCNVTHPCSFWFYPIAGQQVVHMSQ